AGRWQMPCAAIGFAAVVSMIPGVLVFRMASGLVQLTTSSNATLELLEATIADGMTDVTIILAMSFGLIVPKVVIDRLGDAKLSKPRAGRTPRWIGGSLRMAQILAVPVFIVAVATAWLMAKASHRRSRALVRPLLSVQCCRAYLFSP